jgi:hypothetical protein
MNDQGKSAERSIQRVHESEISRRRKAPWLQSAYPNPKWIVADTWDSARIETIDFDYKLADGRSLLERERLCATIKEYAFFLRDDRYGSIDDAVTHAQAVRSLMHIAHALTLRKLSSFSQLLPYDLTEIVEECRYGVDAVLHASERVDAYLKSLEAATLAAIADGIDPAPYGGLPRYINPRHSRPGKLVSTSAVLAACNLPSNASVLPCVSTLISKAAKANGLTTRSAKYDSDDVRPVVNVTVQAMQRWLAPLEQLFAMRGRLEAESIEFRPFPQGAARVAAVKGVGTDRTPIPPPTLALHLLEQSARWIFDRGQIPVDSMERASIERLATACWIMVAAFSARRDEEIDDLREGCIRGDEASGYWLHVYIEKTLQRKEWIPVPSIVARAIAALLSISAVARQKSDSDRLFQWCTPDGQVRKLDVGRHLDDFASAVNVPLHCPRGEPAVAWHWHPHQFRRFFAILYFYRFEGATIEALAHFLRHFNLEMTKRYVTQDPEVAALWTDVEWGYMGDVARSIVAGERSISGAAGERLKKLASRLIDLFRRKLQIVSPERVGASLTLIMQRQGMVLTPKPWVTCSCPLTVAAASKAACRRQQPGDVGAIGPDFAHAGPSVCSNCPHAITEGARVSVVNSEVIHLEKAAACGLRAKTMFGELEAARVLELRHVRDMRYDGAKPLAQALKQ